MCRKTSFSLSLSLSRTLFPSSPFTLSLSLSTSLYCCPCFVATKMSCSLSLSLSLCHSPHHSLLSLTPVIATLWTCISLFIYFELNISTICVYAKQLQSLNIRASIENILFNHFWADQFQVFFSLSESVWEW